MTDRSKIVPVGLAAAVGITGATKLLAQLPSTTCTRFDLLPLSAEGAGYREYLTEVVAKLPTRDLQIVHRSGHDFTTGPITELPRLFPDLEPPPERGVYALRHSSGLYVNSRSH